MSKTFVSIIVVLIAADSAHRMLGPSVRFLFQRRIELRLILRNWWRGAFGRRAAFNEGANLAFDNAAMEALDLGYPDVHRAINRMKERYNAPDTPQNAPKRLLRAISPN